MAELPFGLTAATTMAPPQVDVGADEGPVPAQASDGSGGPETLESIVRVAHHRNYSDVHIGVGEEPRFRDRGDMLREKEYDGSFDFGYVRVRINLLDTLRGPAMVLRLIPQAIATIEDLALPKVL